MKHGNGIRFAIPCSALRRAGGVRASRATARCIAARPHRPSRLAVPVAVVPDAGVTDVRATAARCARNHSRAASAATFARAIACGRAAHHGRPPLAKHRAAPCGADRFLLFALP
ncbi:MULTISPECIES: hypothetical protein [Burkholderia]|uniref:hypothetical protein n=1 Tax=Burkholderia TaxID=32008 RepID=UPI001EF3D6F1|nr:MULTISPECIES: hypothetical protein [unclassified Burkholderia]